MEHRELLAAVGHADRAVRRRHDALVGLSGDAGQPESGRRVAVFVGPDSRRK